MVTAIAEQPVEPFAGLRIVVPEWMAGARAAIVCRGAVYLSPAMWRLISTAEGEELMRVFRAIPVKVVG